MSERQILVAEGGKTISNPSLHVARQFGLRPSDLPGVVFFTELDVNEPGPHEGVFWPIATELFEPDSQEAESEFSYLFDLVQTAQSAADQPEERRRFLFRRRPHAPEPATPIILLTELRRLVEAEARRDKARPIVDALRDGSVKLVKFPGALAEATSIAFGQELARKLVEG